MPKWLKTCLITAVVVIVGGVFAYYYFFVGFTPKQKFTHCAHTCEEIMLRDEDIPTCKVKCTEIANYQPPTNDYLQTKTQTTTPKSTTSKPSSSSSTSSKVSTTVDKTKSFYCNFVWPQEIIYKDSKELVKACPSLRPWCDFKDETYQNVSCCADYDEATKTKSDCIKLPDLLSNQ